MNILDELKEWYRENNTEFHSKLFDDYVDALRFYPYPYYFTDNLENARCVLEFKEDEDMRFKKVEKGVNTNGMRLFGVKDKKEDCSVFDELFMDEKRADKLTRWLNENVMDKKIIYEIIDDTIYKLWKDYDVDVTHENDEWIVVELEDTPITHFDIKAKLCEFNCKVSYDKITKNRSLYRIKEV